MSSFWKGALVGALVGAGAMYVGLERPFSGGDEVVVAPDAGAAADQAEPERRRKKKRRPRRRRGTGEAVDQVVELSARDRQLVWRGPAVALPDRELDFGEGGGGRSLRQGEIDEGIAGARDEVIACIADARGNAELAATITVKFLVEGDGRIGPIRMRAPSYLFDNGLARCMRRAVQQMRFPATGAATVVTVPFELS